MGPWNLWGVGSVRGWRSGDSLSGDKQTDVRNPVFWPALCMGVFVVKCRVNVHVPRFMWL